MAVSDVRQFKVAVDATEVKVELGQVTNLFIRAAADEDLYLAYQEGQADEATGVKTTIFKGTEYSRQGLTGPRTIYLAAAGATKAEIECWN